MEAHHLFHTETAEKWLCQRHLDNFWSGECITIDGHIKICDEKAIQIFLGKCVEEDGFEICPGEPVVVEHLKTEAHTPEGCHRGEHDKLYCVEDLFKAFKHGDCFRAGHKFICEEDIDIIKHDDMCVMIDGYKICDKELFELFRGDNIEMHDGHHLVADFPTAHHDPHSALCREHEQMEFCLENILDLYDAPHDCVMFANEWIC